MSIAESHFRHGLGLSVVSCFCRGLPIFRISLEMFHITEDVWIIINNSKYQT